MQIRTRLTLQFIVTVASILALTLGFVYLRFKKSQEDEFYRSLRFKAIMTAQMVLKQEDKIIFPMENEPGAASLLQVNEAVAIYNSRLQQVFSINASSGVLPQRAFDGIREQGECRIVFGNLPALGLRQKSTSGNEYVVVAASIFQSEELKKLRTILMLSFFIAVGLVALGGWFFAGQAMAPVSGIVNEVDRILPSNMSTRLKEPANEDEIGRLVRTFNQLLDRIYFAFQMQKRFVSNVSHELKNPVSVIISQLEVALGRDRSGEEYRETLRSVLEDTRLMADITEKLLQMARVYSEDSDIVFSVLRLDEMVLQVRDLLMRAHPEYRIQFDIDENTAGGNDLEVRGNDALLRLAITNLLDNGCKFAPDKTVQVRISADVSGGPRLDISDQGPGIPEKDLPLIFQPFYRGAQQAKTPGSGIGLSLVESILRLHQAEIKINSEVNKGTAISLLFLPYQSL